MILPLPRGWELQLVFWGTCWPEPLIWFGRFPPESADPFFYRACFLLIEFRLWRPTLREIEL